MEEQKDLQMKREKAVKKREEKEKRKLKAMKKRKVAIFIICLVFFIEFLKLILLCKPFPDKKVEGLFRRHFNPLPDNKILDWSKLKQPADDNFKFDENRKFSKRVENTVGKGEIAHYEQFLLFPQCFQKACFLGASKGVILWEWVNSS